MEYLAIAVFGLACFCIGVNQGAKYAVKRITDEL